MLKDKFVLSIILITLLTVIGGAFAVSKINSPKVTETRQAVANKELLTVVQSDWVKGAENAQVTVVEYLDFECEACRVYYPIVKQLTADYKDKVKFVVRYFPLPGHKNSMTSALAVEAAGRQGKFWEMHDLLYEKQTEWGENGKATPEVFEKYAQELGLNMDQYKIDTKNSEVKKRITRDRDTGTALGVQGTPTFFVNGDKIPNPRGIADFKNLLDGFLNEVATPSALPPKG